ncbi:MAG: hypothetical protein ACLRMJ_09190 [Alistipes finegoldii]
MRTKSFGSRRITVESTRRPARDHGKPRRRGQSRAGSRDLKAFSIVAGVRCEGRRLTLMPRLPWLWDTMECVDWPVTDADGRTHRIRFTVRHERWLRRCTVELEGIGRFEGTDIRFGPFPVC